MQFTISRESILKPLQLAAGVVERRNTLPVLANVLLSLKDEQLSITATDLEVELLGRVSVDNIKSSGDTTVPAKKLMDICKSLPDGAVVDVQLKEERLILRSGRSRFSLTTLPASDFPNNEEEAGLHRTQLSARTLRSMLESCSFAMAQQDVRYYLNGMLFEVDPLYLRVVATDGHRLAMRTNAMNTGAEQVLQVILPRKAVLELMRLLNDINEEVILQFGSNQLTVTLKDFSFSSRLVDGRFPDYNRVVPRGGDKVVIADKNLLRQAFSRASILSNEKYRGVQLQLSPQELKILANNPEQEEAEEMMAIDYQGDALEVGFNVAYLLDVLNAMETEQVKITLSDANSSALVEEVSDVDAAYVVMPMRL